MTANFGFRVFRLCVNFVCENLPGCCCSCCCWQQRLQSMHWTQQSNCIVELSHQSIGSVDWESVVRGPAARPIVRYATTVDLTQCSVWTLLCRPTNRCTPHCPNRPMCHPIYSVRRHLSQWYCPMCRLFHAALVIGSNCHDFDRANQHHVSQGDWTIERAYEKCKLINMFQ